MSDELNRLGKRLDRICVETLHAAVGLCVSKTHYSVEVEHWLLKLVERDDSDLRRIFREYEISVDRLQRDLMRVMERFRTGNDRPPFFAPGLESMLREAWMVASIDCDARSIRSGALLVAITRVPELWRQAREDSKEFERIKPRDLADRLLKIVAGSPEDSEDTVYSESVGSSAAGPPTAPGKARSSQSPALDQYTIDLTARARAGQIDPVLGRDSEVRQMVDILMRRRQNNPILTGEAGVGKTAVVEGFARRIAEGDVPPPLRKVVVRTLDLGLLQAGAGVRGEFENRLKGVLNEVKASPVPIILFIDEAHTLIGAGGQAGQGDAANMLKPALARGELRTIAATTWAEYKKYFEKDAALSRRFQVVKVDEPAEDAAIPMIRGVVPTWEKHHQVRILEEAVRSAVKLSARYITGRQLPDKAISLMDTTAAKVAVSQNAQPAPIENVVRQIQNLDHELAMLDRESRTASVDADHVAALRADRARLETELAELNARWEREKALAQEIWKLRDQIETPAAPEGDAPIPAESARETLDARVADLRKLQGDSPLISLCVDAQAIAEVVSGWTGVPVGKMQSDEIQTILGLEDRLGRRVVGQGQALRAISQRIQTSRAGLTDPRRPIGVFLLVGPSGVGKTETALTLADTIYGGERNLITINMSEYQEKHTVSSLKGSPPGYVGYGEGGVLTEAVRRKPYSVVLLDEIEKAHRDVHEVFYQVFDKGMLEDGEGREIDFKNTVIILTSNVGTDAIGELCKDPAHLPEPDELAEQLKPDLLDAFQPAFLGRLVVVPYYPISDAIMKQITRLQLDRIGDRIHREHKARLEYSDALVDQVAARCTDVASGARNVDHILTRTLLPAVSAEVLARMSRSEPFRRVAVDVDPQGQFTYALD